MNIKSEHKEAFEVIGFSTYIKPEEGYKKCPEFWEKEYTQKYKHLWETMKPETHEEQAIFDNKIGMLALCIEGKDSFEYMIAGIYRGGDVPQGMKLFSFPESDWVMFSAKGAIPQSLQSLNTEVWQKWYPTEGQAYIPNSTATIEYYTVGDPTSSDYECGIWIPVIPKKVAYCGLNCEKCDAYIATVNNDNDLREKTAKIWSEYNNVEITPEMINCLGCRGDGVKTPYCDSMCEIRKCAMKKSLPSCGNCPDIKCCEKVKPIIESNDEARKNLNI